MYFPKNMSKTEAGESHKPCCVVLRLSGFISSEFVVDFHRI